jgi:hypothetical protein
LHFGKSFFLIWGDFKLGANGFDSQQGHGHVATPAATKHASAAATAKAASSSSAAAALAALASLLRHCGSDHKCQ